MIRRTGNSIGGVVELIARNVPAGLGDPVFDKLEADLAKACMSLPAAKGFEVSLCYHFVSIILVLSFFFIVLGCGVVMSMADYRWDQDSAELCLQGRIITMNFI